MYTRSTYEGSEVDYNSEAAQLKVFTQFGTVANEQKFYELVREKDKATKTNTKDPEILVCDYSTTCKLTVIHWFLGLPTS
jgi:hypothetical protein